LPFGIVFRRLPPLRSVKRINPENPGYPHNKSGTSNANIALQMMFIRIMFIFIRTIFHRDSKKLAKIIAGHRRTCTVHKMNSILRQKELIPKTQTDIARKFKLKVLR
jgi:hypothetical protein